MDTETSSEVLETVADAPRMEKEDEFQTKAAAAEPETSPAAADESGSGEAEVRVVREEVEFVPLDNMKPSEDEVETKDGDGEGMPEEEEEEQEDVPEASPERAETTTTDESPKSLPDLVALDTESEDNVPEQQNVPEPAAKLQLDLEPEPDALAAPEAPQQTVPEPEPPKLLVEPQPPMLEEKQEAEEPPQATTAAAEPPVKEEMEVKNEPEEVVEEKPVEVPSLAAEPAAPLTEAAPAEPAGAAAVEEPAEEPAGEPAEKPAEGEKEAEAEKTEVEAQSAEPTPEEPPAPAPGSLSFAILEQEQTKGALRTSRTLVVLTGLPGSGKSFLAQAIADAYQDHCCVLSADDHGVKPDGPADAYQALDEAVAARSGEGEGDAPLLIVVDDTNHTQERLGRMGEMAKQHHLVVMYLEPRTQWSRDVAELSRRSGRGLEEQKMETLRGQLDEASVPLFFGWFLLHASRRQVQKMSEDFLKFLNALEEFKKHVAEFKTENLDLEQYFNAKRNLHCTTKFCDYGKAEGSKEYAMQPAVREQYGSVSELSLTALFVTPRTVGARVALTEEQLLLWPADPEKEAEASMPLGSRAHVTLGCAEGVEAVQTGLDLLEILALQQGGQQGEPAIDTELGSLVHFEEGRWMLELKEPVGAAACFSSFYGAKKPAKKEPEKKKKKNCTIL